MYINSEKISIDEVVGELYDFSKIGAISIPEVLTAQARIRLYHGAMSRVVRKLFKKAERKVGEVMQDMENLYVEKTDHFPLDKEFLATVTQFREEYGEVYKRIAEKANFSSGEFNSLGFNLYKAGSIGITPHRDFESDRDLVSIFVINGHAGFFVFGDENKINPIRLNSEPGTLILLRAARNNDENKYRPYHSVEGVVSERLTAIFRHETKQLQTSQYS